MIKCHACMSEIPEEAHVCAYCCSPKFSEKQKETMTKYIIERGFFNFFNILSGFIILIFIAVCIAKKIFYWKALIFIMIFSTITVTIENFKRKKINRMTPIELIEEYKIHQIKDEIKKINLKITFVLYVFLILMILLIAVISVPTKDDFIDYYKINKKPIAELTDIQRELQFFGSMSVFTVISPLKIEKYNGAFGVIWKNEYNSQKKTLP